VQLHLNGIVINSNSLIYKKILQALLTLIVFSLVCVANDIAPQDDISFPNPPLNKTSNTDIPKADMIDDIKETIGNIIEIKTYSKDVKKHPIFTHFAASLPFAVFFISLFAILKYKKFSIADFILLLASGVTIYATFISGNSAYNIILNTPIPAEAKQLLHQHKKLGSMLLLFSAILIAIRTILLVYRPNKLIIFYLFIFVFYLGFILYQSNIGINMVYDYGMGVYYDPLEAD